MGCCRTILVGAALLSLGACAGTHSVAHETTPEPSIADDLQVRIEGSSLVLIEDAASTPLVVYFEVDSDVVDPKTHSMLDALALFLNGHVDRLRVEVYGHADERGSDAYNAKLSLRRAKSVRRYLVSRGVDPSTLVATGFGKARDGALRLNRRVEFGIRADVARAHTTLAGR